MFENIIDFIEDKILHKNNKYTNRLRNNGSSAFDYSFMMSIDEKDYPKYLKEAYKLKFGQKLNLRNPKSFNEKIQWLKIYDNLPIKTQLTDKVLVRDFVEKKIGEQYLKPVLQICQNYDEINFNTLPNSFIVKCNHACRWHFIVKNKEEWNTNKSLVALSKRTMDNWLSQSFFGWSDFELQYKEINPKIIIEPLLRENLNTEQPGIQIYCFNGEPKIFYTYKRGKDKTQKTLCLTYDENYKQIDLKFLINSETTNEQIVSDETLKKATELSKILSKDFKFVRVDWMIYDNKLYFEEMTFTPFSGFCEFSDERAVWNKKLGNMLNLKGN